jgi:hypothetical protein
MTSCGKGTGILLVPLIAFFIAAPYGPCHAGGDTILPLAADHLAGGDYHSAITECMRYQFLHPGSEGYPRSMLLMGEAYFRGGNYYEATNMMSSCHTRYRDRPEGERALLSLAYMRLVKGSPFLAYRTYQEYNYIYGDGALREEASADICYALALQYDVSGARSAAASYRKSFPDGRYTERLMDLERLMNTEVNRPRKSLGVSVGGSLLLPGFGHFYVGKYAQGALALLTNAALLYLTYDGYRDDNTFRAVVFGVAAFGFYQYSLYAAITNVYEHNSREGYYQSVRMAARTHF